MFQSTRPHGARPALAEGPTVQEVFQSTRPHGARPSLWTSGEDLRSFNPRARMGRDPTSTIVFPFNPVFQSTRPHGARQGRVGFTKHTLSFQSTRPHGARLEEGLYSLREKEFQSTRPHGARPIKRC